ncbi:hypothetical protein [Microcoleus sp. bin38.metabat.b11b12b14.051]|uniref:hypothetical protein n=1 Tax=Microcoleus sp. bin38.metabat.b11b12b14.051 TaxID=2742709 RepID=UPI0025CCB8B3|nr:hypothetical protein [Microcoleus sp. bin38.metabat.b11b12b14.051]
MEIGRSEAEGWGMGHGAWRIASNDNCQLLSFQQSTANNQLLFCQQSTANNQLTTVNCQLSTVNCQLL